MKKFFKLLTLGIIMALFILTPTVITTTTCVSNLVAHATADYEHSAPNQSEIVFDEEKELYDLASWTKPSNSYLLTQQVTPETNQSFHDSHADNTISNEKLGGRSPFVMINEVNDMTTSGAYTTSAITLSANSYYKISVDYYVIEQANKSANIKTYAFGTFYLNNLEISLRNTDNNWNTAIFYIRTDKLETTSVTPKLYFGSETQSTLGGIYFDKFTVAAVSQNLFETELATRNESRTFYHDYSKSSDYVLVDGFDNNDFTHSVFTANSQSYEKINTTLVRKTVGFGDKQQYFYPKAGLSSDVMLLKANESDASLSLNDYTLSAKPHEIFMFQFYSIATKSSDFSGFHFWIGDTSQQITSLTDYPHYNGWQLNTVFFIAGSEANQEYQFKFTLANKETPKATGWACIDEFKVYKVNGNYAANNESALGVHRIINPNTDPETLEIPNSNFNLGQAADTVNQSGSTYPYPLIADSWNSNKESNGIVHLDNWNTSRFGEHPGQIENNENNHVYMMHNATPTGSENKNTFTSPELTTEAGKTTYISFYACSTTPTQTRAYILTAEANEQGELTNAIKLHDGIEINEGDWHHYEFAITEDEFANTRKYYLRFEMEGSGYAYIDNVRTSQEAMTNSTAKIDLTNVLIDDAWQTANDVNFDKLSTNSGLILKNKDKQKTVIQNAISYNLSANEYFEIIVEAQGNNAYLGLSNFSGLLAVNEDTTYKLYLHVNDTATTVNLQATLGTIDEEAALTDGDILIKSIKLTKIKEDQFNLMQTQAASNSTLKILTTETDTETEEEDENSDTATDENNFFGQNWWFLIPSLITALALLLGVVAFMLRKIKFDRHIVKKTTSYARDMRLKNQRNKIVAQKSTKVDNVVDDSQNN